MSEARKYTHHLLDLVHDGALDKDHVIMACVKYMSEADVQDMMEYNGFIEPDKLDDHDIIIFKVIKDN